MQHRSRLFIEGTPRTILVAVALAAFATSFAHASTIYRCSDGAGGVLYADSPCAGGKVIDLPQSNVDPGARERLQRELDAFDKRQALRDAERARQLERQAQVNRSGTSTQTADAATAPEPYYPYAYGYGPYYVAPQPPPRPRPRPVRPRDSYIRLR